jgi:hypothetical protein
MKVDRIGKPSFPNSLIFSGVAIASIKGSAIAAPTPFNNFLLDICHFLLINATILKQLSNCQFFRIYF